MLRFIDCTNDELANALHTIEGHEDCFDRDEKAAWREIKYMVLQQVANQRALDAQDAEAAAS